MSKEDNLFREMAQGIKPMTQDKVTLNSTKTTDVSVEERRKAALNQQHRDINYLSDAQVPQVDPLDVLSFKMDGLQTGVFKKLRLGKYTIDGHLDLHRHTVAEARTAMFQFIRKSLKLDCRTVLVTHGKGEKSNPPARIKSYVFYWLQQIPEVMAFHSAQPKHGDVGSVYVLLRKSSSKRHENRESFSG